MSKQWTLSPNTSLELQTEFADFPALLVQILVNRGFTSRAEAERFLNPSYERDLHDPSLMLGMEQAVMRINEAVAKKEPIVIFGDYDADGVPGTAVLYSFFKHIGHEAIDIYIPDRHNEAYGLNIPALTKLAEAGTKLVITVDCGIANVAEAKAAKALGLDLIITDHHLVPSEKPEALAILNSKQADDAYPYDMLCGAGVAFKLVQGLIQSDEHTVTPGWEKWLLDLVAIATVSDMVPLTGENRALAYFGLKVLRKTRRLGLVSLYKVLNLRSQFVTEDDIGFSIGPRLNSASRMSHASEAFNLLTTADPVEAETIARHLEAKNKERRESVEVILKTIEAEFGEQEAPPLIVLGNESWSLGVLGLTAARVAEKYNCPVFLWGKNGGGEIKGSCRSDGTVNMVDLMLAAGGLDFFANFGGHRMAGGFSILPKQLPQLPQRLAAALEKSSRGPVTLGHMVDATLSLEDVTETTWHVLEKLAPFGIENPKPVFLFPNVEIASVRSFGNGGIHLELGFKTRHTHVTAIGFFLCTPDERGEFDGTFGHRFQGVTLEPGRQINLLATIEKSYFKYKPELRLRIVDISH